MASAKAVLVAKHGPGDAPLASLAFGYAGP
jgi:hypothetical protein